MVSPHDLYYFAVSLENGMVSQKEKFVPNYLKRKLLYHDEQEKAREKDVTAAFYSQSSAGSLFGG